MYSEVIILPVQNGGGGGPSGPTPPNIQTITSDTTVVDQDFILVDATAGNINITLSDPVQTSTKTITIKRIDNSANSVSITPVSGGGIETGNSFSLLPLSSISLIPSHNNTNQWWIE